MIIYSIRCELNTYQALGFADADPVKRRAYQFDCRPWEGNWRPPELYIPNPKLKRGNFLGFQGTSGTMIADDITRWHDELAGLFEMSGELLPMPHGGENFHVVNVLNCQNCLIRELSKRELAPLGEQVGLLGRYEFYPERLPDTPLFKVPETSRWEILCIERFGDDDYEFKHMYERLGLTGLYFEKLWSDEG